MYEIRTPKYWSFLSTVFTVPKRLLRVLIAPKKVRYKILSLGSPIKSGKLMQLFFATYIKVSRFNRPSLKHGH